MTIGIDRPFTPTRRRRRRRRHRLLPFPPVSVRPSPTTPRQQRRRRRLRPARAPISSSNNPRTCRVHNRSHRIATTTIGGHPSSRSATATATGAIDAAIANAVTCTPNSRPWPASKSCATVVLCVLLFHRKSCIVFFLRIFVSFLYRHGLDIRGCLLRMICEAKHYLLPQGKSFFHDVLRILF